MKRSPDHPSVVPAQPRLVRCAIYTRKSTEEGLQQAFNTLDAHRESAEAYIASQKAEGWTCLPDRYDDGGFTGGNIERPAVKRLLADIEAGKIDCVVVYKVDRLSRSLLDFSRMMQVFEDHNVSFVSVTQHFNTTHSMGRLTLNILLSFAQFEREIISERTRDKIAAARRKGKFAGGRPVLGYDIQSSPQGPRLIVNEDEAERVRKIFALYLQHEGLIPTVTEIRCLIDANWGGSTDVVYQFCRQSAHAALLMPSHGRFVGASTMPFDDYKRRPGERVGHHWRIPSTAGKRAVRHVLIDTNYWKSFVQARLAVAKGDRGCLSLFDSKDHRMFADHLTAEYRVQVHGRGRSVDEWKVRSPGRDNHWLDCLVGCAAAASMLGATLGEAQVKPVKRERIKLSEVQKTRRTFDPRTRTWRSLTGSGKF